MKKNILQIKFAKTLYKLAADEKEAELFFHQLMELSALSVHKQLLEGFHALSFSDVETIQKVLTNLFGNKIAPALLNMMTLLVANRQVILLPQIAQTYRKTYFETEGIKDVVICTSRALSDKECSELTQKLSAKNKVYLTFEVDKNLIGGVQISENGKLTDLSLRSQLEHMRRELLGEHLV